ncbi:DUF2278 family protein [Bacillus cereus]|uniref:DUF2278 family protein n=1 Tax=Bacillus cereus TaxID=1396 RepID=UPI00356C3F4B
MPIPIYALLKANGETIEHIRCQTHEEDGQILPDGTRCETNSSPHFHFSIRNNETNRNAEIVINVRSQANSSNPNNLNLLCYINENFDHPITSKLIRKNYGYHQFDFDENERMESEIALDYYRMNLFDVNEARQLFVEVPTTSEEEDLNDKIFKYLRDAKEKNADVYIFGDAFPHGSRRGDNRERKLDLMRRNGLKGFHDVHMNQGNTEKPEWIEDNGIYQDGALLIHFTDEQRWMAFFTRFQSQCWDVDEEGNCNTR